MELLNSSDFSSHAGADGFSSAPSWAAVCRLTLLAFLLTMLGIKTSPAQVISHEYELKAVFLFNFAKFTQWPTNAFTDTEAPFVVGILGTNPFGNSLETAVEHETYEGRKFAIKYFPRLEEVSDCQILFIGRSEDRHLEVILDKFKDKPILTVSEITDAAYRGTCVRFVTENNKIRLRINLDSVKKSGLVISSQLLRLAEIVRTQEK